MVIKCAWCQKDMGTKEPLDDPAITHGCCADCVQEQLDDLRSEANADEHA